MFESLLIANRGEIARRIERTARRMGIRTIAVHSSADASLPFVREADEAICIGPAPAAQSYLDQERVIGAARQSGADAIHPGYGFLSENADFATRVMEEGFAWVGAPPAAIRIMGRKDEAKQHMMAAGVPVTPGYLGEDQAAKRLLGEARRIGYPLLIKAVAGGGGKGMRRVDADTGFLDALASCRREAAMAFGDERVLLERYVSAPRHLEVQVFGDTQGTIVHLFERDCSLQRRHQKVIEEAPAPGMTAAVRDAICAAAVKAARSVGYVGAGTIEFIADTSDGLSPERIWFMEMNTRLQVEHPVTEAISGLDLVEWQLRVASGEPIPLPQHDVAMRGWAMEARLYAENPASGFLPSTGRLDHLRLPKGLRIDSGFVAGCEITPFYDPLLAKLVSHGATRAEAVRKLAKAVAAVEVWPVQTNAAFLARMLHHPRFLAGEVDTGFIESHAAELIPPAAPDERVLAMAAAALVTRNGADPWSALTGFRLNAEPVLEVAVEVAGTGYRVNLAPAAGNKRIADDVVFSDGQGWRFSQPRAGTAAGAGASGNGAIVAPMPGNVIALHVQQGQHVNCGEALLVLEAMKMEQVLRATCTGTVADLAVSLGSQVIEGRLLMRIVEDR